MSSWCRSRLVLISIPGYALGRSLNYHPSLCPMETPAGGQRRRDEAGDCCPSFPDEFTTEGKNNNRKSPCVPSFKKGITRWHGLSLSANHGCCHLGETSLGVSESVCREGSVRTEDLPRTWQCSSVGWDFRVNEAGEGS